MTIYIWDENNKEAGITLSGGDLVATRTGASAYRSVIAAFGMASGKWYWELTMDVIDTHAMCGVGIVTATVDNFPGAAGDNGNSWGLYSNNGNKYYDGNSDAYGDAWTTDGVVIGFALDMDNNKLWMSVNGVWGAAGDPAAGTGEAYVVDKTPLYPMYCPNENGNICTANFGATPFVYTPPVGYDAPEIAPEISGTQGGAVNLGVNDQGFGGFGFGWG